MLHWNLFRSCAVLGTLALAACAGQAPFETGPAEPLPTMTGSAPTSLQPAAPDMTSGAAKPVAVLLPLTGTMAPVGDALQNAVRMAFAGATTPTLDIRDTAGTPAGAAAAAQAAIAAGDGMILGPLTSGEAHAVAPIAAAAAINVLAFTNDSGVDAAGVWALGVTPAQQVARVVQVAVATGHTQIAALLPDDQFGHALGDALTAAAANGATLGSVVYYTDGDFSAINQAVQQVSDFADRGQPLEDKIKAAQDLNTDAGRATALQLQHQPIPPPSFTALFIGGTDAETLTEMANLLPYYAVTQPQVQFLGPALWADIEPQVAAQGVFNGALFAAPDPAAAGTFDGKYQAAYGAPPPAIAHVAFDAAAIARLAGSRNYATDTLTSPSGFSGADGALLLQPDGQVLRGLAVFSVAPGSATVASPAPAQVTSPAS